MSTDNIISFGSSSKAKISKLSGLNNKALKACRPVIANNIPNCFKFLEGLDDILFKLADKAQSNQEQEQYFVAMRQFRINQEQLAKDFTTLILDDFDLFCTAPATFSSALSDTPPEQDTLPILDNEFSDEDIANSRIIMKAVKSFGNDILDLNIRLSQSLNINEIKANPLDPERIVKHLNTVVDPLLVESTEIKVIILNQFEQHAVSELKKLVHQLNDILINQGILPDLDKTKSKPEKIDIANLDLADLTGDGDGQEDEDQDPAQFFEGLRQFLNNGNQESDSTKNTRAIVDHSTVLSALSNIQQQPLNQVSFDENGSAKLPDVRQELIANIASTDSDNSNSTKSIGKLDNDVMDLVNLLFEFILDDEAIPAPIRAMLARLQIPLLKIALNDKKLFSQKDHPARRLLNNLASASTGWSQQSNVQQDKLQTKIDSIVSTILTDFDSDVRLFLDLNTDFNNFVQQLQKSSQASENRVVQENEGQEKLVSAQQEADNVVNSLLSQHQHLPKAAVTLINEGWKHVLKLRLLQKGKDSEEWTSSVDLMNQLVWSVSPKSEASDRKKLLAIIPGMLKSLREGLSGASFNQHKITALFKELQKCHVKCMNGSPLSADELQNIETPKTTISPEIDLESLPSVKESEKTLTDAEAMRKAKNIVIGSWLEITEKGIEPERIKLSWRSNLSGRCVFVNYQGLKAAEVSISELASWFQQDKILVIDQSKQLMDRALDSLVETMSVNKPT